MTSTTNRLTNCFQTVFSDLRETEILNASQSSAGSWDSIGAITLMNVIEDEFGIQMDFDRLAELDSFERIQEYLTQELQEV